MRALLDNNPLNTRDILVQYEQPAGGDNFGRRGDPGPVRAQQGPVQVPAKVPRRGALFGQITGYFSFTYGTDGLEDEYNSVLTKTSSAVVPTDLQQIRNFFTNEPAPDNVHITILASLQQIAARQWRGGMERLSPLTPLRAPCWRCTRTPATTRPLWPATTRVRSRRPGRPSTLTQADRCCRPPTASVFFPARLSRS